MVEFSKINYLELIFVKFPVKNRATIDPSQRLEKEREKEGKKSERSIVSAAYSRAGEESSTVNFKCA